MSTNRYLVEHNHAYQLAVGVSGTSDDSQDVYVLASDYDAVVATLTQRVERLEKALQPFANLLPDDVTPKDALQKQLQLWAIAARSALRASASGEGV